MKNKYEKMTKLERANECAKLYQKAVESGEFIPDHSYFCKFIGNSCGCAIGGVACSLGYDLEPGSDFAKNQPEAVRAFIVSKGLASEQELIQFEDGYEHYPVNEYNKDVFYITGTKLHGFKRDRII